MWDEFIRYHLYKETPLKFLAALRMTTIKDVTLRSEGYLRDLFAFNSFGIL